MLPEENELVRLEKEQAELEDQVASAELDLETEKHETARFQRRYYHVVGKLYARLDEIAAQIASLRADESPHDSELRARADSAEQQAQRSSAEAGLVEAETKAAPAITPDLKQAYRRAVKLMHPDLAASEHERLRRTKLMALLNLAYERGDLVEIEKLTDEFEQDPEEIIGTDVASRIVKAIRRIAQLRRRLSELREALEAHHRTEAFKLRETVENAEALGADPLVELAEQLTREISERERELKAARHAGGGYRQRSGGVPKR